MQIVAGDILLCLFFYIQRKYDLTFHMNRRVTWNMKLNFLCKNNNNKKDNKISQETSFDFLYNFAWNIKFWLKKPQKTNKQQQQQTKNKKNKQTKNKQTKNNKQTNKKQNKNKTKQNKKNPNPPPPPPPKKKKKNVVLLSLVIGNNFQRETKKSPYTIYKQWVPWPVYAYV